MRPIANFTFHAILAAALAALAASSAAAGPVSGEVFVRLPPGASGKGEHIEIESYQWGSPQSGRVSKVDGFTIKQGVKPADPGNYGEWMADVERPQGSGDMTLKGSRIGENAPRAGPSGAQETLTVGGAQTESQATGKRQHKPFVMQNYYDQALDEPLPSGSVRVKVKMPWLACKVGNRYPTIELGGGARTYRLTDAVVTGCGTSANRPTESISFSYAKVDY